MKTCQYCNKQFEQIYKNQVYCCYEHSKLGKVKRQKELYQLHKVSSELIGVCKYCGKKFTINTARKYCSDNCRRLYRNKTRRKSFKTPSKPSEHIEAINHMNYDNQVKYNGILIKIENHNNQYSWKAIKNNKEILSSASNFYTYKDCLKDAKEAF